MKKICFVCEGNVCRSPMAEKIMSFILKKNNFSGVKITSFGLNALDGSEMTLYAKRALKNLGIKVGSKKSKSLKKIESNCLYITMTQEQKQALKQPNVFSFAEIVRKEDISDPFNCSQEVYNEIAIKLYEYCILLMEKLQKLYG